MRALSRPGAAIALAFGLLVVPGCSKGADESARQPAATSKSTGSHPAAGPPTGRQPDRPTMPASLSDYRAVFSPIWRVKPASGRSARACEQFSELQKRAEAIDKRAPEGVDAATWQRARESLTLCNEGISEYCDDEDIGAEDMAKEELACINKAVAELSAMFATAPRGETVRDQTDEKRVMDSADGFAAFDAAFAPLAANKQASRLADACGAGLFMLAMAVDPDSAPAGADAARWRAGVTSLREEAEEFGASCGDTDPAVQSLARNLLRSMTETWQSLRAMRSAG